MIPGTLSIGNKRDPVSARTGVLYDGEIMIHPHPLPGHSETHAQGHLGMRDKAESRPGQPHSSPGEAETAHSSPVRKNGQDRGQGKEGEVP